AVDSACARSAAGRMGRIRAGRGGGGAFGNSGFWRRCAFGNAGVRIAADPAATEAWPAPGPAAPADAAEQIVMVEGLIALYRDGRRERTRAEALAHFARLGLIVLDSGRAFHPGYR